MKEMVEIVVIEIAITLFIVHPKVGVNSPMMRVGLSLAIVSWMVVVILIVGTVIMLFMIVDVLSAIILECRIPIAVYTPLAEADLSPPCPGHSCSSPSGRGARNDHHGPRAVAELSAKKLSVGHVGMKEMKVMKVTLAALPWTSGQVNYLHFIFATWLNRAAAGPLLSVAPWIHLLPAVRGGSAARAELPTATATSVGSSPMLTASPEYAYNSRGRSRPLIVVIFKIESSTQAQLVI